GWACVLCPFARLLGLRHAAATQGGPMKLSGWVSLAVVGGLAVAQGWVDRSVANGPAPRTSPAMCFDPIRNYVLLAGGKSQTGQVLTDTWSWNGTTWTQRGSAPNELTAMAHHPGANKLLGFSFPGNAGSVSSAQCYEWDGSNWVNQSSIPLSPAYAIQSCSLLACYDAVRREIVVLPNASSGSTWQNFSTVAVFDGTTWRSIQPLSGMYPAKAIAWDPTAGRILMTYDDLDLVVVGAQQYWRETSRLAEWSGLAWTPRFVQQAPSRGGAICADLSRGTVVAFDEIIQSSQTTGSTSLYHTWQLSSSGWEQVVTRAIPGARTRHAMVYVPLRNVTVLFGGQNQFSSPMGDTWELTLGTPASFTGYGTGCPGSRGVPQLFAINNDIPRTGSLFEAQVNNLPWNAPTFLLFGLSNTNSSGLPLPFDLSVAGAHGCTLLTSIDNIIPLTNVLGSAVWSLQIPHLPGASFYLQAVPFELSANALGVALSNGGHGLLGL
ncbi:MAG: kelch repeat-containing protein, partial [Planctomycetota bacterium]